MRRLAPRHQILAFAALFISVFFAFSFYFLSQPSLADGDSYYHLGIAKQFNERGIFEELPWARFSVMREHFGDKELLFHLVLAGFTASPIDAEEMGRLAVAFFNAVLFTLLGWLATRALGWWGLLVPAYIYLGSYPFADRVFRLRPELMALTLLLLLIWLAARRRYVFLALVAALFALAYTAWHVVALLALLFAIADRFRTARLEWKTPAAILGGLAGGLLVHPHFPHNLIVWWYQNVLFFFYKNKLDVGTEIHPPTVRDTLLYHLPVVLSLVIYWLCTRAATDVEDEENATPARYFLVAATLFALLFLGMARMVTWLIPLAVLAVIFRRRIVVRRTALTVGLAVTLAAAAFQTVLIFRQQMGELHVAEARTAELGRSIPNGAKVAASWRYGTVLVFYAPQGRYFNVLDPVFMAASHPREHAISERIWSGDAVDVAAALRTLDSDFILFDRAQARPLYAQIARDPRLVPLFGGGGDILAQLSPAGSAKFLRDWRIAPCASAAVPIAQWPLHSWSTDSRVREMEAYVDLARAAGPNCSTAALELPIRTGTIEIAPSGPTQVHIDGVLVAKTDRAGGAVLGTGLLVPLRLPAGTHWLVVTTCRSGNQRGFYALVR